MFRTCYSREKRRSEAGRGGGHEADAREARILNDISGLKVCRGQGGQDSQRHFRSQGMQMTQHFFFLQQGIVFSPCTFVTGTGGRYYFIEELENTVIVCTVCR